MKEITFKGKLNNWDIKYKWFHVTVLPNWLSDWKVCLAVKWKIAYKWTESQIYELLYWWKALDKRKEIIEKYFNN